MIFFHAANASKSIKLPDGQRVTFEVYRYFGGCWEGVGAVDDPAIIAGLDELTRKPKSGITRITEAEYTERLQKKKLPPNSRLLPASPSPPTQPVPLPINDLAGRRAVVVNDPAKNAPAGAVAAPPKIFESLDGVLKLGVVKPVEGSDPGEKREKDMGEPSAASRSTIQSRRPKYISGELSNPPEEA